MHVLIPLVLGVVLVLGSTIGLLVTVRFQHAQRRHHQQVMTSEQVKALQANYHANAVQMVHDLNRTLEPEGKRLPERFVMDILAIDPKAVYDQSEEGHTDA